MHEAAPCSTKETATPFSSIEPGVPERPLVNMMKIVADVFERERDRSCC